MALTGEPDDVAKTHKVKEKKDGAPEKLTPETMAFSGCSITSGVGKGLVVAGARKTTCFCFPDTSANQTPLQQNLNKLGARIGVLAIIICIGIFIIGWLTDRKDPSNPDSPVQQEVLVRKIAAVETLGSASVICSDKTGTLTEGKMTMVGMYAAGTTYEVTGKGFDPEVGGVMRGDGTDGKNDMGTLLGQAHSTGQLQCGVKSSLLTAILCCNTTLSKEKDEAHWELVMFMMRNSTLSPHLLLLAVCACQSSAQAGVMKWTPKGNSSEAPIVVAARKVGLSENIASDYPRVLEVPFSSSRKMMLTVSKVGGTHLCAGGMPLPPGTNYLAVCKGAPNYIIDLCCEQLRADGSVDKLTDDDKANILKIVDGYSARALCVLAIASRPMSKMPYDESNDDVLDPASHEHITEITTDQKFEACRKQLRLIGLVASIDPERDGVPDSVVAARGAGIRVVMITGDYLLTAIAIAKNVNILQPSDDVETSAMDCANLRPDGEYLRPEETEPPVDFPFGDVEGPSAASARWDLCMMHRNGNMLFLLCTALRFGPDFNVGDKTWGTSRCLGAEELCCAIFPRFALQQGQTDRRLTEDRELSEARELQGVNLEAAPHLTQLSSETSDVKQAMPPEWSFFGGTGEPAPNVNTYSLFDGESLWFQMVGQVAAGTGAAAQGGPAVPRAQGGGPAVPPAQGGGPAVPPAQGGAGAAASSDQGSPGVGGAYAPSPDSASPETLSHWIALFAEQSNLPEGSNGSAGSCDALEELLRTSLGSGTAASSAQGSGTAASSAQGSGTAASSAQGGPPEGAAEATAEGGGPPAIRPAEGGATSSAQGDSGSGPHPAPEKCVVS
ncbi:unnamed protein product [Cladocopium goreaui]|uniref:P-type sodium-transporting ATPase4 n=1 Tax=Cladocopium goreaui TaxID=2562237 RepID=A0A9P1DI10_9DINO|nr:unnamed protein product [Cladocopium goreaui]